MASSKTIQVRPLGGGTWFSLPAPSADISIEAESVNDSILGQTWMSNFNSLASWSITTEAIYKNVAGYQVNILKQGTSTATTGEAMSLVSGQEYRTTSTSRDLWDANQTVTIYDNAVDVTDEVAEFNYLLGTVVFDDSYTVIGPVTADFNYLPVAVFGCFTSFTLNQTDNGNDRTCFQDAVSNGGLRVNIHGQREVSLDAEGFYSDSDDLIGDLLLREVYILEIQADGNAYSKARGYFRLMSVNNSGAVGDVEAASVSFSLSVPSSDYTPFTWDHDLTNTTLSSAVLSLLDGFSDQEFVEVRLLPNGVSDLTGGRQGQAVVSDISLSSSVDGQPSFSVTLTGNGGLTDLTP